MHSTSNPFFQISYRIEGTASDSDVVNTVTSVTESIQLVNLQPSTNYIITVTCVNAAGPGNTSTPVEIRTDCKYYPSQNHKG